MTEKERADQRAYRQRPEVKEKMRRYRQLPEIKTYQKTYKLKPEVREKKRIYAQRPEVRAYHKIYNQRPEVKARREIVQKAYKQKPEAKERARLYKLREHYGLTQGAFAVLLAGQGYVCAGCGSADWGPHGPLVDHNHDSGVIRGILCFGCNVASGFMRDDVVRIRKLADYLEKNK